MQRRLSDGNKFLDERRFQVDQLFCERLPKQALRADCRSGGTAPLAAVARTTGRQAEHVHCQTAGQLWQDERKKKQYPVKNVICSNQEEINLLQRTMLRYTTAEAQQHAQVEQERLLIKNSL